MRRVVVTGIGAVTPCGADMASTWEGISQGRSAIAAIQAFDTEGFASKIAGECRDFDPLRYFEKAQLRRGGRFIHLAVAAASQAIDHAGFEPDDALKERTGTYVGAGFCGIDVFEDTVGVLRDKTPRRISPYFIPSVIANLAGGQVSMRWGFKGPNYSHCSACASGAHAIGDAFRWIQYGKIDAAIAGGTEAAVTPVGVGGFAAMRALSKHNDEPERASRPFDQARDGFVIAEGAALLVLEEREAALKRGAKIWAEIIGYGASSDAYHMTQPAPEAEGAQRAMKSALEDAVLNPEEVDYINAHGTSTVVGDGQELLAIHKVFGAHATAGLAVSSTKSVTGHLLGAAGGLEAALLAYAIEHDLAPPTINLDDPDPTAKSMNLVAHRAQERPLKVAMSNSFGFGGTNACLIFKQS